MESQNRTDSKKSFLCKDMPKTCPYIKPYYLLAYGYSLDLY